MDVPVDGTEAPSTVARKSPMQASGGTKGFAQRERSCRMAEPGLSWG